MTAHFFVHAHGICESTDVGERTTIWAFSHVLPGARLGSDCNINDGVFIENDVIIGDRVTVKSGVQLWDGLRVGDDVFVGPNATFTNDPMPRSKVRPDQFLVTRIEDGASIGANATILPGISIGRRAMIGAGAVVTRDVPAHAKVVGNPGRIIGYIEDEPYDEPVRDHGETKMKIGVTDLRVQGAQLIEGPEHTDMRGSLVANEFDDVLPFRPRRMFVVYDVPSQHVRGEHAHYECWQYLVCVAGSVNVHLDDGHERQVVALDSPCRGVVIPPMVWASQFGYTSDATLLVLASHPYEDGDYIRDYQRFINEVERIDGGLSV